MARKEEEEYKLVPGRGLVSQTAIKLRLDHLRENGFVLDHVPRSFLDHTAVQNNIESYVGSTEIPLGIVGPLLFQKNEKKEYVYTLAGTLEGALVASMNRGAKAISYSGGFSAKVLHQKMVRAPLFILENDSQAKLFQKWIRSQFENIKSTAEKFSNHAKLISIQEIVIDQHVHVRFVYTTADAAGQNMTTTCTWHAMLWIVDEFAKYSGIKIEYFIIEGNGSSDKKVSRYLVEEGRGISVMAECLLEEEVIKKVLRTSSDNILRYYAPSVKLTQQDGMLGFNINVANTIASIFVATGQDLASIHESSIAHLYLEKRETGLYLKLSLPSLVIGTLGGGTSLPAQQEALKLMNCAGTGKVEYFAQLIAGFALSLEISTYAAIVSGEFAKAHEKLGRNKPANWLLKNELNETFIKNCLRQNILGIPITSVHAQSEVFENGILTSISQRVNKKLIGFFPFSVLLNNGETKQILVRSKALDLDVIKGLHLMAASIDPALSDLIYSHRQSLEYWNSHLKELSVYECLSKNSFKNIPEYYGQYINDEREIYLLFQERLAKTDFDLFDSENSPQLWTADKVRMVISSIHEVHAFFASSDIQDSLKEVQAFDPLASMPLYKKMVHIVCSENEEPRYQVLKEYCEELKQDLRSQQLPHTIIHNDFNPRNLGLKTDGKVVIYDWELAVKNIPHRDIVEFLSFSSALDFNENQFLEHLKFHFELNRPLYPSIHWATWKRGYTYALKEFLICRASFYKVSEILMKLKFGDRILLNAIRMIEILDAT